MEPQTAAVPALPPRFERVVIICLTYETGVAAWPAAVRPGVCAAGLTSDMEIEILTALGIEQTCAAPAHERNEADA